MTIKNNTLIRSTLTNMTIKLEKIRDKKYARNKNKTHLNPIVAFIQLQEPNCDVITSHFHPLRFLPFS